MGILNRKNRIDTVAGLLVDPVMLATHHVYDGWLIRAEWLKIDGRLEPVAVRISATEKDTAAATFPNRSQSGYTKLRGEEQRALNADVIRRLPIGEMLAEGRVALTNMREDRQLIAGSKIDQLWPDDLLGGDVEIGKPQRGRSLSADDLDQVAMVYRRAWAEGRPVNEAVREAFYLSKDGAAKRIGKARAAGLLEGIGPKR
jgi:hypothetical protein